MSKTPRPVTATIKGSGFESRGGGFTVIIIDGVKYHPDDVASAVKRIANQEAADVAQVEAHERWKDRAS